MNRGSEWRKWDLHFHTPSSHDYKDKSVTNQDIIDKLVENNISAIAITDHHHIDVLRIKDLQKLGRDKITVLPGIEFCSELGGSESIHFIGIFPENCDLLSIWTTIQGKIGLTDFDIKEKGGYENIQCDLIDTCDIIHDLGGITSIHAGTKTNSIESIKNQVLNKMQQKKRILSDSIDILELGKEVDGLDYGKIVFPNIGFHMPMIICSDNHNIKEYALKQNLWIKADASFEGLKQIIYEPEERVEIQELKPDKKAGYQVIDSIEINDPDFLEQKIFLSSNLNSIIGGRSTGKSILLGSVAKKLASSIEVKSNNEGYNEFIKRLIENINIHWQDNEENTPRDIDYFPQGFMYKIAKNDNDLRQLINRIVIQNIDKETVINDYQTFSSNNTTSITNNINKVFQLKKELSGVDNSLKEKGDRFGIVNEITRLKNELAILSKQGQLATEEVDLYNALKDKIGLLNKEIEEMDSEFIKIELLKNKFFINADLQFDIISLTESTQLLIQNAFSKLQAEYKQKWSSELDTIIASLAELKSKKQNEILEIEKNVTYIKGAAAFQNNIQHKEIELKLKVQNERLTDIEKLFIESNNLSKQLGSYIIKVKEEQELFFTKLNDIKSDLVIDKENLRIEPFCFFNLSNYKDKLYRGVNQQSFQGQEIANFNSSEFNEFKTHINNLFDKLFLNSVTLKGGYSNISFITDLLSTNYYDISYNVIYDGDNFNSMSEGKQAFVILKLLLEFSNKTCPILIDQPEDDLDNRAIYNELAAYLKKKKKERQIILVTHNPNIAVGADSELIIVANQNGLTTKNIKDKKFQYKSGSLENTKLKNDSIEYILDSQGIKEHVCEILEGGNEAFKQRERKYSLIIKSTKA